MKKLKYVVLFLSIVSFVSCKKDKENLTENTEIVLNDSLDQVNSDSVIIKQNTLQTFEIPPEVQGCSCLFAKNKEDFDNKKYIYVDDYGNTAYIKLEDKMIEIPMREGDFDPSDFSKVIKNSEVAVIIKGKKIKEKGETTTFEGELTLEKKMAEKLQFPFTVSVVAKIINDNRLMIINAKI